MKEKLLAWSVQATACLGILIMAFILMFLAREGLPVLKAASLKDLLCGTLWYPAEEPAVLGMGPLILGSLSVTLLSCLFALPVGIGAAIFLSEAAPGWMRETMKPALELLGFVPSIILGFLGMVLIAPWLQSRFQLLSGLNCLNASLLLGVMMVPIVGSLAEDALEAVPQELREGSYALGATRWETVSRVVLPAALPGLLSACLLGIMRALGETMVVLMASGGAALIPTSVLDPVRPLTSTIAAEMGETAVGSVHSQALFFAGLLLLVMTLLLDRASALVERWGRRKWSA